MDINRVFFWFCKEQGIIDIMFSMYQMKKLGTWRYDNENGSYFERLSLKNYLTQRVKAYGFKDVFWELQPPSYTLKTRKILSSEKYKKARSKWNSFVKKNLMFSDEFLKVGDKVELSNAWGRSKVGTVIEIPKTFDGSFMIKSFDTGADVKVSIVGYQKILVNDVEKEPEYYIKRRRKVYGANKE